MKSFLEELVEARAVDIGVSEVAECEIRMS